MRHALILGLVAAMASAWAVGAEPGGPTAEQLDKAFKDLLTFKIGAGTDGVNVIQSAVVKGAKDEPVRADLEKRLCAVLTGEATAEGKDFACRQLFILGGPASVPALAGLLHDERLSHLARSALEKIPGEPATQALREALAAARSDKLRVGFIHTLSRRGDARSLDAFCQYARAEMPELAGVALMALSKLDDDKAAEALLAAYGPAGEKVKPVAADACLTLAGRYLAAGKADKALAVYEKLYAASEPLATRVAALQGLVSASGETGAAVLLKAMTDPQPRMQAAALSALRSSQTIPTDALAQEVPKLPAAVQPQVILALGDRGDASARPVVVQALGSGEEAVRLAAIQALGSVGCPKCVAPLADLAAGKDAKAADAARSSLARMGAPGVQEAMIELLQKGRPDVQVELAGVLAARNAAPAVPALLAGAASDSETVRKASFAALRRLAGPGDAPALIQIVLKGLSGGEADEAESAALAALRRIPDPAAPSAPVVAAWPKASSPAAKASLLKLMAKLGGKDALPIAQAAASDADKTVKDAGVRALVDWPEPSALAAVQKLAESADEPTHKILALRGMVRLIPMADIEEKEMIALYARAMSLATRADEKKLVLASLAGLGCEEAKKMAQEAEKDPALAADAKVAVQKIEQAMSRPAKVMASNMTDVDKAIDGDAGTRWTSGAAQAGGEWFLLDLGAIKPVKKIILDTRGSGGDYPRGYEVYVSNNRAAMGTPVVKGEGKGAVTEIVLSARPGRYVKIVQTGQCNGLFWSIHEIKVE